MSTKPRSKGVRDPMRLSARVRKLTWADVRALRSVPHEYGALTAAARELGITRSHASKIRSGECWREESRGRQPHRHPEDVVLRARATHGDGALKALAKETGVPLHTLSRYRSGVRRVP